MSGITNHKSVSCKESILDVGYDLLMQHGYRKLSMEDVASAVGCSRAALYLHFENKNDLVIAIMHHHALGVLAELKAIAKGKGSPKKRLEQVLNYRVMSRIRKLQNRGASVDELLSAIRSQIMETRQRWMQSESELIAELILEGRITGDFECNEVLATAEAMVLATNSLMPFSLSLAELGEAELVESRLNRVIQMCLRSIQPCIQEFNSSQTVKPNRS